MENLEFERAFKKEFPEFDYLFDQFKNFTNEFNNGGTPFVQYVVEYVFELVDTDNEYRGFSGDKYSEETYIKGETQYSRANQYTFNFLKEKKHMLVFWLL